MMNSAPSPAGGRPLVGVVLSGGDNADLLHPDIEHFNNVGCPFDLVVASPWVTPERMLRWADEAVERGIKAILAAGGDPLLAAFVAAACNLPVIVIPPADPGRQGAGALDPALGRVRPGSAVPLAAVRAGGAADAALLALRILAAGDPAWHDALARHGPAAPATPAAPPR
ncbi:MAG: AIR carboxylase family protein, partial [bacterium]|nr:AIR carboxylase family protein [bacterium]